MKTINHAEYQKSLKNKTDEELRFIAKDAQEAIDANQTGENAGYYQDEWCYVVQEQGRRRREAEYIASENAKCEKNLLRQLKTIKKNGHASNKVEELLLVNRFIEFTRPDETNRYNHYKLTAEGEAEYARLIGGVA